MATVDVKYDTTPHDGTPGPHGTTLRRGSSESRRAVPMTADTLSLTAQIKLTKAGSAVRRCQPVEQHWQRLRRQGGNA